MGAKQSSGSRPRSYSHTDDAANAALAAAMVRQFGGDPTSASRSTGSHHHHHRARASSIPAYVGSSHHGLAGLSGLNIPSSNGHTSGAHQPSGSPDSDSSDEGPFRNFLQSSSLPPLGVFIHHGIKCPVCSKFVQPDDIECHLVMCLTKPRITYNVDVLTEDKDECVICLEDLVQGDTIARLPCLCIYHKTCIDAWFERNRSCPEHPND